ncbi:hypothetical protein SAMN06265375_1202 [Muriicola jejuensis]|uniref:hypothetical protein n=1 Tax=Muriicola jejuensis TaxID=504488 RepID=UPI001952ECBD|nr:hypothetical protein [Muriicola jejuensis]SMP28108.1 hypothetical protein SAMN06265375_1202 [Muriicola jejuensis]
MIKHKIQKPHISIKEIGKSKFWIGVLFGLSSSVLLAICFSHFEELMEYLAGSLGNEIHLQAKERRFYSYFFAAISSVLGLSISITIWLTNLDLSRARSRIYAKLSQTYTLLYFWALIAVISRFVTIVSILPLGLEEYNNELNMLNDYYYLLILMVLVVFLNVWFTVRMIFKSTKWMIYSFALCIALTFILANIYLWRAY